MPNYGEGQMQQVDTSAMAEAQGQNIYSLPQAPTAEGILAQAEARLAVVQQELTRLKGLHDEEQKLLKMIKVLRDNE